MLHLRNPWNVKVNYTLSSLSRFGFMMKHIMLIVFEFMLSSDLYAEERCDYVIDPEGNYIISCPNFYDNPSYYQNQENNKFNKRHR
jgi:hypothetical protein